jgi:hypothetical protein
MADLLMRLKFQAYLHDHLLKCTHFPMQFPQKSADLTAEWLAVGLRCCVYSSDLWYMTPTHSH